MEQEECLCKIPGSEQGLATLGCVTALPACATTLLLVCEMSVEREGWCCGGCIGVEGEWCCCGGGGSAGTVGNGAAGVEWGCGVSGGSEYGDSGSCFDCGGVLCTGCGGCGS